jgi:ABC-type sugar transport system ATPase subunit
MARVVFDGVSKSFGDIVAIDRLDLDIASGEFLVLLGPSGCGKTTALRLVAGLDEPSRGTIRIGDEIANGIDPKDRNVAMVFQSYALYPTMSVRRNIAFALTSRGVTRTDIRRAVDDAAAMLDLRPLLDRKPAQLSGGQRQRVALARAIVRNPSVFLMDEPLSNLDASMRAQTRAELVALHRRLGTTFVYVTHDQSEAMSMADRIAVMRHGALQQLGVPTDVYDRPANVFVARFIGSPPMNVLAGVLDRGSVVIGGVRVPACTTVAGARHVDVGVRPEHVRFAATGLPARVDAVESLGHERLVHCSFDGRVISARLAANEPAPPAGAQVNLELDSRRLHLFDNITGARLGG